jgi:hypothetical protein
MKEFPTFYGVQEYIIELVKSKPLDSTQSRKNLVHTPCFFKSNFNMYFPSSLYTRSRNKHFSRGRNVVGLHAAKNKVNKPLTFNFQRVAVRNFRTSVIRKRGDCPSLSLRNSHFGHMIIFSHRKLKLPLSYDSLYVL